MTPLYIYQGDEMLDLFGPETEEWMFRVGSFVEGGIPITVNLDRIPTDDVPYFWELEVPGYPKLPRQTVQCQGGCRSGHGSEDGYRLVGPLHDAGGRDWQSEARVLR